MAVRKFVKYAAPYRSSTFNANNSKLVGVNGVLRGGEVTTSGSTVTIQPLTFVQNGGIVDVDSTLSATLSGALEAPYFVAVSVSTMVENLAETITPTFVKRPQDLTANTVLVAEWDGQEWRSLPRLDLGSVLDNAKASLQYLDFVGVTEGFDITDGGASFTVSPGAAVLKDGDLTEKLSSATLTKAFATVGSHNRIDEIVLRKPMDSEARSATLKLLTGLCYDPSGAITKTTPFSLGAGSSQATAPVLINDPNGVETYYVFVDGSALKFAKSTTAAITSASAPTTLSATGVTDFDAIMNPDGSIDIVYTLSGTDLAYQRITTAGAVVHAETVVETGLVALSKPKLVSIKSGAGYFLHIVLKKYISGSQVDIGYVRLSASNTVETPYQTLVNLGANLAHPSIDKDDDDSMLYLVFENADTGRIYLRTYDASTVTAVTPPAQYGLPVELQDDTYNISTAAVLAATGALEPVVKRTANKELYVFWRHFKGSGKYGVAVYCSTDLYGLGYKAYVQDYVAASENIERFRVVIDDHGSAHLLLDDTTQAAYAKVRLEGLGIQITTTNIVTSAVLTDLAVNITPNGRILHAYADSSTLQGHVLTSTGAEKESLRDIYTMSSDVLLGAYRNSDSVLSVQGNFFEENATIRRLYEYNNLFAATGSVTWGTPANTLIINASIAVRAFNRVATYTIAANAPGGVVVPLNNVCYVQLPDDDTSSTLTLQIKPFGEGILDRHNRNTVPLFWNIGGVLYTKFAPFRLEGGSTVVIGSQITDEMLSWLGASSVAPDPANHAYTSTTYIANTDSHNAALGKLDAAVTAGANNVTNGLESIAAGVTSVTVTLSPARAAATYRLALAMENTTDTDPMIQPMVVTAKSTGSFTVSWNVATDSANYKLNWHLMDS